MVHDGAIEAITAYLVKWMAKEQKNHKPKKLLKKVAKKGIASPEAFKEWLARLKSGAIPGYRLDASEGVIKSTSGPPPSSPLPP